MKQPKVTKQQDIWGIHMEKHVGARAIDEGFVAIGWRELKNLNDYTDLGSARFMVPEHVRRKDAPRRLPIQNGRAAAVEVS